MFSLYIIGYFIYSGINLLQISNKNYFTINIKLIKYILLFTIRKMIDIIINVISDAKIINIIVCNIVGH